MNSDFIDLGQINLPRKTLYRGALASLRFNYEQFRTDILFSPVLAREMEQQGKNLLRAVPRATKILYWGAMNFPTPRNEPSLPYWVVTDGPYDPDDPEYPVEWRPRRWSKEYLRRQRGIYSGAESVFALSGWARDKVIRLHNLTPERVVRIGWGPMHQGDTPNFEVPANGYFISVGSEWKRKGMDIVSEATGRLHDRYPEAYTILIGEPRGLSIPKTEGVLQMPYSVPGPVTQLLIANARALIVGSRFDASPHVVYEALQVGTPVIGASVCGVPEAIQPPQGGRVIAKEDPGALAAAMEDIWKEDIATQRHNAYEVYRQSGGWEHSARVILKTMGLTANGISWPYS